MAAVEEHLEQPEICRWIRSTRERLKGEWEAAHLGERGNPYTQEKVAARLSDIGVTRKTYAAFETHQEPSMLRLRQIALAMFLDEDYFLPSGDLSSATVRLEAEGERLHHLGDQFESLIARLQALAPGEGPAPARDGP